MNCWDRGLDKSLFGTTTGTGLELGGCDGGATPAKKKSMAILKIRYTYKKWNQVKKKDYPVTLCEQFWFNKVCISGEKKIVFIFSKGFYNRVCPDVAAILDFY